MNPKNKKADVFPAAVFVQGTRPPKYKWRTLGLFALLAGVLTAALHYVDLPGGPFLSAIGWITMEVQSSVPSRTLSTRSIMQRSGRL
jgi:hypothetical protein